MGKVKTIIEDQLISPEPDRNPNRIYIYRKPNDEVSIHFRNIKVTLITPQEIQEWREGFRTALENFEKGNCLNNDI